MLGEMAHVTMATGTNIPIAEEEVHHMQRREIFQLNGQMECSQPPGIAGQGGRHVHPLGIDLQQLLDVPGVHGVGQLLQQALLAYAVLYVLTLLVLPANVLTSEVTAGNHVSRK